MHLCRRRLCFLWSADALVTEQTPGLPQVGAIAGLLGMARSITLQRMDSMARSSTLQRMGSRPSAAAPGAFARARTLPTELRHTGTARRQLAASASSRKPWGAAAAAQLQLTHSVQQLQLTHSVQQQHLLHPCASQQLVQRLGALSRLHSTRSRQLEQLGQLGQRKSLQGPGAAHTAHRSSQDGAGGVAPDAAPAGSELAAAQKEVGPYVGLCRA